MCNDSFQGGFGIYYQKLKSNVLRRELDVYYSSYENFLLLRHFNSEMTDPSLKEFCNLYLLKNLIKKNNMF